MTITHPQQKRLSPWVALDLLLGFGFLIGFQNALGFGIALLLSWIDPSWAHWWPGFVERNFLLVTFTDIGLSLLVAFVLSKKWEFVGLGAFSAIVFLGIWGALVG